MGMNGLNVLRAASVPNFMAINPKDVQPNKLKPFEVSKFNKSV